MNYKQIFLSIFTITIGLALTAYTAYGANPEVTNVQASQRTDGSMLVDISYDMEDADGDAVTISINVSDDDGLSYDVNATSITGATGEGITPGTWKSVVWDAGTDVPGVYGTEYRVKVLADDGKGDESTAGYKASVVLGKAFKYNAFTGKSAAFRVLSVSDKNLSFNKIANQIICKLNRSVMHGHNKDLQYIPSPYPSLYPTPQYSPYPYITPSYSPSPYTTPWYTPHPYITPSYSPSPYTTPWYTPYPYETPYPYATPTPDSYQQGIEGFTYNGDGTFTSTPENGVTCKLSFYKSDGTQITVDVTDPSNYLFEGELYGEDYVFVKVEATVDVIEDATSVQMELSSDMTTILVGNSCYEELKLTGKATYEFAQWGKGKTTNITLTYTDCSDHFTGHADITVTIDGSECIISHDFDENGCQGGIVTCGEVQLGEMTREDDGSLYYTDFTTGEETLVDESVTFGSGR